MSWKTLPGATLPRGPLRIAARPRSVQAKSAMGNFDAFDKAKKAAERASQTALGVKEQAASKAAGIRDLTVSKAQEATSLASDVRGQAAAKVAGWKDVLADKVAEVKGAAFENVRGMVDDLNAYLPALGEAGYTLKEVSVEVGITPKVVAMFAARPDITQESVDAVIAEHAEAKVVVTILRALYAAYRMQNGINIAGMKPLGIALEIGVTPAVAVKFG